jgi:hypothetical protein
MLKTKVFFCLLLFLSLVSCLSPLAYCQQPLVQTNDLQIITPALAPVATVNAAVVGQPGPASYYYWVVAKYSTGNAAPSPAATVINAPNVLNSTNYVQVSWQAVSGAASYDLLRTTSPQLPTTPAAIAVSTAISGTTYSDQGAALSSYTISSAPAGQPAFEWTPLGLLIGNSYGVIGDCPGSTGGAGMQWVTCSAGTGTETIASGTATLGTAAIASGACASVVTVAATGVLTTDVVSTGFNSDPTDVTGYGVSATGAVLTIYPYPTAGDVNFKVCNSTSASITPGAMTLNWRVTR